MTSLLSAVVRAKNPQPTRHNVHRMAENDVTISEEEEDEEEEMDELRDGSPNLVREPSLAVAEGEEYGKPANCEEKRRMRGQRAEEREGKTKQTSIVK